MANETTLTLVGNLTDEPDLRFTPSGVALCKFSIAATPRLYDQASGQWKDGDPMFMTCTAWRQLAENAAESLAKGARVVVTGRLKLARWETPEGEKRQAHQLDIEDIGASMKYATVKVQKLARKTDAAPPEDAWASTSTDRRADDDSGSEPPF